MSRIITVYYEKIPINYELTRKKVKNINMRIKREGIFVSASNAVPLERINQFVVSKAEFIFAAQKRCEGEQSEAKNCIEYNDGDKILILGKAYILKLVANKHESVYLQEDKILLSVKDLYNFKRKSVLIKGFVEEKCREVFLPLCEKAYNLLDNRGIKPPLIKLRHMKSRWGSCHTLKSIITLNTALLEKPIEAIEYVIIHEYAHLIVANHSKKFYSVVEKLLPDYKERKKL